MVGHTIVLFYNNTQHHTPNFSLFLFHSKQFTYMNCLILISGKETLGIPSEVTVSVKLSSIE
jgi:hypothetical protein